MADEKRSPHSLATQTADQIRNEQRGGGDPTTPAGPEANDTMRRIWSDPGGEAYNYRNAMVGAGGKADDHSELTAAETPETHKHLSDASLTPPKPQGPAADAVDRATAAVGHDADDDR
ncbi:MAG TPA: hypothetical protein VIL65_14660 [Beijerinckiaceae bacterium]|jgi:hypothetical protein